MGRLKAACHSMKLAAPVRAGAAIDLAKQLQQVLGDSRHHAAGRGCAPL